MSGSLAHFVYSPAYFTRCPSVHASTTLQQPIVPASRRTDARFLGTVPHRRGQRSAPRYRKRSSASFYITQVARRPNLGVKVGTRGRSERLSGLPQSLSGRRVISRWLFFGDPLCCVCSLPSRTVSSIPFSGSPAPLFEAYRTRPFSPTVRRGT